MATLDQVPPARRDLLQSLKTHKKGTILGLAKALKLTREAVRQHLVRLEADGLVSREASPRPAKGGGKGRPTQAYVLSPSGEALFPKAYSELSLALIDAVAGQGEGALNKVLASVSDAQVKEWLPKLEGLDLPARAKKLRDLYWRDDPYMKVEAGKDGLRLIEGNCPYLDVASRRPALCSVSVNVLKRLLGAEVVREERFQNGQGRCVFRVLADKPVSNKGSQFEREPEPTKDR